MLLVANPFADAIVATGTALGLDPYLLIQSVVPLATESPEFVVVAVLVANHRPAQGMALFLASSVSQWTLGMGAPARLPGGGRRPVHAARCPRTARAGFTMALTLFIVVALCTLRPHRADAFLLAVVFVVGIVYPAPFIRFLCGFVLLVFAIDLTFARWRSIGPLLRAAFGRQRPVE